MTQRQEDLVKAGTAGEPHGAAFGMSKEVIENAGENLVNQAESALNLKVAQEKVKKSGAGEWFVDRAVGALKKMESWFNWRHAANESNASARLKKAGEQRSTLNQIAEAKAAKMVRSETYKAAKAQFNELSPKGITLALPEIPNIINEVRAKYNEFRVKANEGKAEKFATQAERYGDIAKKLRNAANAIDRSSDKITDSRHKAAESDLKFAETDNQDSKDAVAESNDELSKLRKENYLQPAASGESTRISVNPDQADQILSDSKAAWAEKIAPNQAVAGGTK